MSPTISNASEAVEHLLSEVRARIELTSKQVRDASAAVMALRMRQTELFRDLAKLRLDTLAGERTGESLELAERQAVAILRERDEDLAALRREIMQAMAREESLAGERVTRVGRIEALKAEIGALEGRVEAELARDPAYQAQVQGSRETEAVATRAGRKAEQAAKDRAEKGKPYEADPLFMYLWKRGYGTERYRDWPLYRYLDAKVARLCDFDTARAGYAALLAIPERLASHAERLRAQVEEEAGRVDDLEGEALAAAGHTELTEEVASEVRQAKQLAQKLAASEAELKRLQQRHASFVSGADEGYQQALGVLAADVSISDLRALYDEARATPMPEDDRIVAQLEEVDDELEDHKHHLTQNQSLLRAQSEHLNELEALVRVWRDKSLEEDAGLSVGDIALTGLKIAGLVSLGLPLAVLALAAAGGGSSDGGSSDSGASRSGSSRRSRTVTWSGGSSSSSSGSFGGGGFKSGGRVGGGGFKTGGSF
jgi:chromosome segregation ATPase